METLINGRDLILSLDGSPFAVATGCSVNMSMEFIETSSPTQGVPTSYLPTTYSWTASSDGLVVVGQEFGDLMGVLTGGRLVRVRFINYASPEFPHICEGDAYIESMKLSSNVGNHTKYSITLKGSGALSNRLSPSKEYDVHDIGEYIGSFIYTTGDTEIAPGNEEMSYFEVYIPRQSVVRIETCSKYRYCTFFLFRQFSAGELEDFKDLDPPPTYKLLLSASDGVAGDVASMVVPAGTYSLIHVGTHEQDSTETMKIYY